MPTVLWKSGFRFFFFSNENNEPAHIHVQKGSGEGKIWLEPSFRLAWTIGFSRQEETAVLEIASANKELFLNKWYEYFGQ